ncbi:hypothetical protein [Nocardia iowensis]|uniref:Uncharacterized protein n=1 Tax=Nocardia iowensis TaxID=204891 RepID=A0ABX8RK97_NOCIO|nr:hypothetical protein [Nocardia iowensis]QXN88685.1 hypothetical protein KV110_24180 [Nocardia iowensis]
MASSHASLDDPGNLVATLPAMLAEATVGHHGARFGQPSRQQAVPFFGHARDAFVSP